MYKEIFIFIVGSTPQVITETICALALKKPPVYPSEIYVITTSRGRELAEKALIEGGILKRLSKDYGIPAIPLSGDSFVIPKDNSGGFLDDIRSDPENEIVGDLITNLIREKTAIPNSRLHCSLAGGRKTMSFYIGAAMQLFARPWDKLYHVLVTPEFESNPDFFYKPVKDILIECRMPDGAKKRINTKNAEIRLAELPFIRLSGKILLHKKSFSDLVEEGQREIDTATIQPELRVDLIERTIYIGDTLIELVPVQMMLYTAFLRQKLENCRYPERQYCDDCRDCFIQHSDLTTKPFLEKAARDYSSIYSGQRLKADELLHKNPDGMKVETVRQNISKINKAIKEQLNDEVLLPYFIICTQKRYASSRYGVIAEKGRIRVRGSKSEKQ